MSKILSIGGDSEALSCGLRWAGAWALSWQWAHNSPVGVSPSLPCKLGGESVISRSLRYNHNKHMCCCLSAPEDFLVLSGDWKQAEMFQHFKEGQGIGGRLVWYLSGIMTTMFICMLPVWNTHSLKTSRLRKKGKLPGREEAEWKTANTCSMKIRGKMEISEQDNLQEEKIRYRKSTLDGRLP